MSRFSTSDPFWTSHINPRDYPVDIPEVEAALKRALASTADYALSRLRYWSRGGMSLKWMSKHDHPYATRHGRMKLWDRVNSQKGRLRGSYRVAVKGWGLRISNNMSYASFLLDEEKGDTRTMFVRSVIRRVKRECDRYLQEQIEKELGKLQ